MGAASQLNEGIAVNPAGSAGTFYVSASSLTAMPPAGPCPVGSAFTVGKNVLPTLWVMVPLPHNVPASGLAFDAHGNLYAADPCANDVAVYSLVKYSWTYSHTVRGAFSSPLFLTIAKHLAVPSTANPALHHPAYVTVIDLTGRSPNSLLQRFTAPDQRSGWRRPLLSQSQAGRPQGRSLILLAHKWLTAIDAMA